VACALGAALLAAAALPGNRFGVAAAVVMCALIATAVFVRRGSAWYLVPAALLAPAPFIRDAGWVVVPDLVAAFVLTALAAGGAHEWATMRSALGRTLRSFAPGIPAVIAPAFGWLERERIRSAVPLLRGLGLGAVLLIVFGTLFISADAAFAEVVHQAVPSWSLGDLPERVVVFALVAGLAGALALTAAQPRLAVDRDTVSPRLQPPEWIPAIALLDLLFAAFVAVQLTVLFGGHDHVLRTTGLTYAQYARHGFVELIVAAALTLAVAAIAARHAARKNATQRRALYVLTGILFALTLVVLASALRRLGLYEDAFGFTRMRLLAHGIIVWLGALFVLVGALAVLGRAVARPVVVLSAVGLIAATFANPDAMIAARNADRFERTGKLDAVYLSHLSADAVPRLARLPVPVRSCVLAPNAQRLEAGDTLAEANVARARARDALAGVPLNECKR
jgi:MFS family permease